MARVRRAVLLCPLHVLQLHHATLVRMKLALLVTILHVPGATLVPLQIPEQVSVQPRVLLVPRVCIRYRRTLPYVRRVPPLPTPPLSNAPLLPTKKLPPVMLDITERPVKAAARDVTPTRIRLKRVERHRVQNAQVDGIPSVPLPKNALILRVTPVAHKGNIQM